MGQSPPVFKNTHEKRQKVHSSEQIIPSVEFGGSAALQFSHVGLNSSMAVPDQPARACVACVTAAPARREAATIAASTISASVAPALRALPLWISMQYGHCVVSATATAISSLYLDRK